MRTISEHVFSLSRSLSQYIDGMNEIRRTLWNAKGISETVKGK